MSLAVQSKASASASGQTSFPLSFTTNTTAGNTLVAFIGTTPGSTITITDSQLNTWTIGPTVSNNGQLASFYLPNCPGGALTVTAHGTTASTIHLSILEYTNIPSSSVLSASGSLAEGSAAPHTVTTSGSVSQPRVSAIAAFLSWSNGITYTAGNIGGVAGAIETQETSGTGDSLGSEDVLLTAASGTITANITFSIGGQSEGIILVFNTNSGGGGGPTTDQLSPAFDVNLFDFYYPTPKVVHHEIAKLNDVYLPILPVGVTDEVLYPIDLDYPNVKSPYVHEQQIDEEVGTSQFIILPPFKSWDEDMRLQFEMPNSYGIETDSGQDNTQFIIIPKGIWDNDEDNQRGQLGGYAIESQHTDDWTQFIVIPSFDPSLSLVDDFIPQNSQLFVVKDDSTDDFKFIIIPAFDPSQSLVDDYLPQQKTDNVTIPQDDIFDEISFTPPIIPSFDPSQSLTDSSEFLVTQPFIINLPKDMNMDNSFIDALRRYIDRQRRRRE